MQSNLISALAWISKGYALKYPKEYDYTEEEINQMKNDPLISKNLQKDLGKIQEQDELSDSDNNQVMPVFCQEVEHLRQSEEPNNNDQYPFGFEDMSEEEKEDYQIKDTDALIIAAKIENEYSSLEIYIYEEEKANLFVHHEIQLSAFPLAVEWLPIQPNAIESNTTQKGNYAIVASFLPEIEIWNLDVVNVIEPTVVLGGEADEQSKKKVKHYKQKKKLKQDSHTDSVISLGLNKFKTNILCSGSADYTVKLWDIIQQKSVYTYQHHQNKLQITKWNPSEESILLTAAEDKRMCLFDVRTPKTIYEHQLKGEIESACWDPITPTNIVYSTEQGQLIMLDARKIQNDPIACSIESIKAISSVSMSPEIPGLLATTSLDGKVRVYDTLTPPVNGKLFQVCTKNPKLNKLYCGQFYQDSPWNFACGSSKGELFVWDLAENKEIVQHFGSRLHENKRPKLEQCTQSFQKKNKSQMDEEEDDDDQ